MHAQVINGLKLVPKLATIDLLETISLPLHVMKAMQQGSHTHITMAPIPESVCSHIITDKQWLQENIMCLLSNAVKYSARGGAVRVSMKIITKNDENSAVHAVVLNPQDESVDIISPRALLPPTSKEWKRLFKSRSRGYLLASTQVVPTCLPSVLSVSQILATVDNSSNLMVDSVNCGLMFLHVEVEDTGIGLSEEVMGTLFRFVCFV